MDDGFVEHIHYSIQLYKWIYHRTWLLILSFCFVVLPVFNEGDTDTTTLAYFVMDDKEPPMVCWASLGRDQSRDINKWWPLQGETTMVVVGVLLFFFSPSRY